ncbi:MAG: hypothetical protein KME04_19840 [Pleurocapsa minor GSE-CHR-MK-17-07R]|jgi:hypothetical protein|nr:hypothetical protein [Pleurocapsa minor GSE-CHR-MK 17-07R]
MAETRTQPPEWLTGIKSRGMADALSTCLDITEPFGVLAAQMIYVASPVLGLAGWRAAAMDIARALEQPDELERLRGWLASSDSGDPRRG